MSAPGQLDAQDAKKIGKSLLLAMAGAALAYVATDVLPMLPAKYAYLAPFASTLVAVLLKAVQDTGKHD